MAWVWVSVLVCIIATSTQAQKQVTTYFKSCPEVTTKDNFDILRYVGRWYPIQKFPNSFSKGKCTRAEYTLKADGNVNVNNSQILDGKVSFSVGEARENPNANKASELQVRFSSWMPWGQYLVLDTDYDSYTIVYSCTDYWIWRTERLWIMSRQKTMSEETLRKARDLLTDQKICIVDLQDVDHKDRICNAIE